MSWLGWLRHTPARGLRLRRGEPEEAPEPLPPPLERTAPGVAALFDGLCPDGGHTVLDLGPGARSHLDLYGSFARRIRFADFLTDPPRGPEWAEALQALPPPPQRPYDIVLAWNLLDRIWPEARPPLIERLAELTGPGARLYAVVDTSGERTAPPLRFTLLALDRLRQEAVGPRRPIHEPLLPAQVEKLLRPFEVVRAFTLRDGLREYFAVKRGPDEEVDGAAGRP